MFAQGAWLIGHEMPADYYRNAWIEGFSFFTLGYFHHDKQDKLTISNKSLLIIIAVSAVLSVVERFLCGRIFAVHLSTYFLVTSLFIYAIKNPKRHEGAVQRIGKKYSMYVYILHMFWWHWFDRFVELIGAGGNTVLMWFRPLIVLVFAPLLFLLYIYFYLFLFLLQK